MIHAAPVLAGALSVLAATATVPIAQAETGLHHTNVHHVLLVSIDGMHALDYLNCTRGISA